MPREPLLSVGHLSVRLGDRESAAPIIPDLSFDLSCECVALVGESGSGKSLTARRARIAAAAARGTSDASAAGETDLQRCTASEWNGLRGARLSLMLQDPRVSLNPVLSIGRQMDMALRVHRRQPAAERHERIAEMLDAVGLTQRQRLLKAYPHQISGGMGQRIVLAMMLLNDPEVLIADEPTSALDAELREQVMQLIRRHVETRRMGLLLISHDLQMVARHANRALVMYRGRIARPGPRR